MKVAIYLTRLISSYVQSSADFLSSAPDAPCTHGTWANLQQPFRLRLMPCPDVPVIWVVARGNQWIWTTADPKLCASCAPSTHFSGRLHVPYTTLLRMCTIEVFRFVYDCHVRFIWAVRRHLRLSQKATPISFFIFAERGRNVSCYPGATRTHRSDRIWTDTILIPNQAHCQIMLHSETPPIAAAVHDSQ